MATDTPLVYTRVCQECGHRQEGRSPTEYKDDRWRDIKCKKCKSSAMNYGSSGWVYDKLRNKFTRPV